MSNVSLGLILEKIASKDKDFRYMATSDLLNELENPKFKTDTETEKKICQVVLQQLEDSSSDISGLAVKCLGLLVNRVAAGQVDVVLQVLCHNLLAGKKEQQRDIASIGLKTVISEISGGALASTAVKQATPKMVEGINSKEASFDVCNECLDILHELVRKFGVVLVADDQKNNTGLSSVLLTCLLPLIEEPRAGIRKRAIHCLAALAPYLGATCLAKLCDTVVWRLEDQGASQDVSQAYLQTIGAVSRSVGYRFGSYLPKGLPLVMSHCDSAGEEDYQLREYCLQALESFVERCPQDARKFLEQVFVLSLKYLSYDPNYDMDANDDEDMDDDMDEDDNDSDEQYSDDEDMSWKVRRAAAKCLAAIITNYQDLLPNLYPKACPELVTRFKEREENVKADIFATFTDLLRVVGSNSSSNLNGSDGGVLQLLRADVPAIMRAATRQLKEKSVKTKVGVFVVLKELLTVLKDCVEEHVEALMPGLLHALQDKGANTGLKIEALEFLNLAMAESKRETFQPHIPLLSKPVFAAVGERYYKVTSAALQVCQQMVHVMRPGEAPVPQELQGTIVPLYEAVMVRLGAQDQDQEVKEHAISCMATTVALLGNYLSTQMDQVLQVLLERLRNEITRLTAVKAFSTVASSSTNLDLSNVLVPVVSELTSFLRKANRTLRQASLDTLVALVTSQPQHLSPDSVEALVEAAANLVDDGDLHLAALGLKLCWTLTASQPAVASTVCGKALPKAMDLVKSPLLQGVGLEALQQFFVSMVKSGGVSCDELQNSLLAIGSAENASKTAQRSVAQCLAVLCTSAGQDQVQKTVDGLLAMLQAPGNASLQRVSLLILGEIGRRTDLSSFAALQGAINTALASQLDDIKSAGSMALGGITVGSLHTYLPFLLEQISSQQASPKHQYLLLKSLNEVIASITKGGGLALERRQQEHILDLLLANCESEEECRNVVAECAGRLALLNPEFVLPKLQELVVSTSAAMRWLVVTAVRYVVLEKPTAADPLLAGSLAMFLERISDGDRHVRRAAVLTLSTVAHNKPRLIVDKLAGLLPMLYEQTVVREELIRTVDLGPFKHKIDDGLELRKAAFECMEMVLDQCTNCLDFEVFLQHLESGLRDHYDVKIPCHSMLSKLAGISPHTVLMSLDQLVAPLEKTLTVKLKSDAVKQEVDRNDDMLRSCLRAIDALARIPNVESCTPFITFMTNVVQTGTLAAKYAAVKAERQEAEVNSAKDPMVP
eukprot:CAMPEP_0117662728 /NCGR_PEP_ID=MMETSP0804-20121206/8205_1 /TAXON_ID=1074897 /ORGANISM="Tetraselmis astigmatica, Strain CCMP880" /LENGTH=1235 /DNA_ID=CAMNT_0005469641 /DNA_START=95 /DNA_END=3802 /DNA_ORIENTATION=-